MKSKKKTRLIVVLLCFVFFWIYSFTTLSVWLPNYFEFGHLIFNWPDSTANHFFASVFAETNSLMSPELINPMVDKIIHTRSMNVISNGSLVPITFLPAIVIFGLLMKLIGQVAILFLTPLLTACSGYILYRLICYVFKDRQIAFISALLFLSLPAVMFFANVVMLPTMLFIFLVLSGWLAIVKHWQGDSKWWWMLGSLLLSLAVVVRPTEIVWLAVISLTVLWLQRKKVDYSRLIMGGIIFAIVAFFFLYLNKVTYGGYFSLGYLNLETGNLSPELDSARPSGLLAYLKLLLYPFGFNLKLMVSNFLNYFVKFVTGHIMLSLLALAILYAKVKIGQPEKINDVWKKYFYLTPIVFILIVVYYGSWDIADPLVKELNSISISYVRYFLPLYIWILPLTAWGIRSIIIGNKGVNYIYSTVILGAIIIASFKLAFLAENDGLLTNKQNIEGYYEQYYSVSQIVPEGSVIITERTDKIFFPEYKVIVPQGDLDLWGRVAVVRYFAPVYYYSSKSAEEIQVDQELANQVNLNLAEVQEIWSNFKLYSVNYIEPIEPIN